MPDAPKIVEQCVNGGGPGVDLGIDLDDHRPRQREAGQDEQGDQTQRCVEDFLHGFAPRRAGQQGGRVF